MTVYQLIRELQKMPPGMDVQVWSEEDDDDVPVVQVLYEDGCSYIQLLTLEVETVPAEPEES